MMGRSNSHYAPTAPLKPLEACTSPSKSMSLRKQSLTNSNTKTGDRRSLPLAKSVKFKAKDFCRQRENLEDDYFVGDLIGEGGFGEVYACTHIATGSVRCVKVIPKSLSELENDEIRNEFHLLKELDHPNLIKIYNVYETVDLVEVVSDFYSGGDFLDEIERVRCLSEQDASALMNQLLSCVNYCHNVAGIVHRDLKPENILLSTERKQWDEIKVIDFGLAKRYSPHDSPMTELVGTPYYLAPQVLEGSYTSKADVWSCGIIVFLALAGYAPFNGGSMGEVMDAVRIGEYDFEDPVWDLVSEEAKDFVEFLLIYDEDERPTALEALQHPWLVRERQASNKSFFKSTHRRSSMSSALQCMQQFDVASSKLKQATYALLSSQLISMEEREDIDKVFHILDADCSGQLTKDEVQKGFADYFHKNLTDVEIDELFEKVNFSGSGEIGT